MSRCSAPVSFATAFPQFVSVTQFAVMLSTT